MTTPVSSLAATSVWRFFPTRGLVIALTALTVLVPLGLIFYQSLLNAPFFDSQASPGLAAYAFIFDDPDFWDATKNSLLIAGSMALIAVPLGGALAFIMARTDLPGRRWIEPLLLVPVFVSPMVLSFGYVVAAGPVGFYSVWVSQLFGTVPWNVYSLPSIAIIAGLTHVPHVYLYSSAALKSLGSDIEEAARMSGAGPLRVALDVSLPMITPALLYSGVLVFFLGFEIFALALVLGDPEGHLVLATYLFKLTNKLGTPSYHLMAAVAVCIIGITFPLVMLQRLLMKNASRFVAVKGKAGRQRPLALGSWRWLAIALIGLWLFVSVFVPLSGVALRAFVTYWGEGIQLSEVLTLEHFRTVFDQPALLRGIFNTIAIGVVGGLLSVACYAAIGLAMHRRNDRWSRFIDYLALVPRAVPGLLAGLAFLWVFLFFPPLAPLRTTIFAVWLAYTVVWLAYGMRLIQSSLLQVGPELEEAARSIGASAARTSRDVTLPLIRHGLLASWLLVFMIFEREYSTGVYLLNPGTEVIGSLLVSLWATGGADMVAALSLINVVLVGCGLAIALRFGVKLHD
ncbi:ABC transporter, iron(III) transport system permease protein [Oryzomicrobium terrae]|uniref:ABC transporter, iron(III) transport system permease protein n=1 Tax=Oryzomicrobium terrae TaxID=1735038 RepID=A0A5C1E799_9RHOO|nr:iron ABC transporter permease [Oryzomicrobium terrae]QEL64108.1 ABC transporter, iron(III) transport system permease protein [Oryzomicrobium terrae]